MDIHFRLFISMVFLSKVNTSSVLTYPNGINWFNALRRCKQESFDIEHDNYILSNLEALENYEFWIGIINYEELTPWIELKGCYRRNNNHKEKVITNSVGYCQHYCHPYPYFSYQDSLKDCQCLDSKGYNNLPRVNFTNCTHTSSLNDTTFVYQHFDYNTSNDKNEKCMILACSGGLNLSPRMCNLSQDYSIQTLCDGFISPTSSPWGLDHPSSQNICFGLNKNLISSTKCSTKVVNHAWTSAFREVVTIEHFKEKTGETPVSCLSGKRSRNLESNDIELIPRSCNDILEYFVCSSNANLETTSDMSADGVSERDGASSKSSSCSNKFDCNSISTSPRSIDEKYNEALLNNSSNAGALVGGIIGGIVILLVVTLLLFRIRRPKNQTSKPKGVETNGNQHEFSDVQHVSNMHYGLEKDEISSVPEYAVVQKDKKIQKKKMPEYAVVQKEEKISTLEDNYAIISEGDYDKLNNVLLRKKILDDNDYGIAGKCAEGEYDIMEGVSVANLTHANLYDTTVSRLKEGDDDQTYDSARVVQYRQNGCHNTYDHSM